MRAARSGRRTAATGALALVLAVAGSGASEPSQAPPELAPSCASAAAAHPGLDALAAIRAEEGGLWKEARRAGRAGRGAMRSSLGQGRAGAGGVAGRLMSADARHRQLMARAAVLCGCRRQLGDRDDANCEKLYPGLPSSPGSSQPPDSPENQRRKESPPDAAAMDSGS